ncbi:MAG: hypothetical protein J7493_10455 [Porphyrobacter sp.]|nr:hypothetical protein [Porphyrobacter sp.]
MANQAHSARATAWESTFAKYNELSLSQHQAPRQELDEIEREIAALQDELLDTPAPSFSAVAAKLTILWDGQMHGLDQDSEERRLILEDLESLIQVQRRLLGA